MTITTGKAWRVGVLGTGEQAEESRIPSLFALKDEGLVVAAVADIDHERARSIAARFGVPSAYGGLEDMIRGGDLDCVVITTPHADHAVSTISALRGGLHVLCEKPMATSVEEAEEMYEAARRHDRRLAIGYQYEYMVDEALDVVRSGALGTLQRVRAKWLRQNGIPDKPSFWLSKQTGGVGADLLGHLLSALLPLIEGSPSWVSAQGWGDTGAAFYGEDFAGEDTLAGIVRFDNGVRTHFEVSWAANIPAKESIDALLVGSEGSLKVPLVGPQLDTEAFRPVLFRREPLDSGGYRIVTEKVARKPRNTDECLVAQARNWFRACSGLEPLRSGPEVALTIQRVLEAVRESADHDGGVIGIEGA